MPKKKKSRGENHINLTENTKINKFQSESMEIDKYSKLGPKIDEGQRKTVNGNLGQKIYHEISFDRQCQLCLQQRFGY